MMRNLIVYYSGNNFEQAINAELRRLGLPKNQAYSILALPECMRPEEEKQKKFLNDVNQSN